MKSILKKTISMVSFMALLGIGAEVAFHEAHIRLENSAYAQSLAPGNTPNLERGFADLVKRVIPGVVNISTYARPRIQPGYGYRQGGPHNQNELFQRFFEEFFGGRIPAPPGANRVQPQNPHPNLDEGEEDDDDGDSASAPKGKSIPIALGTGFIIDAAEGLILTNNHVVQGAEEVKIQFREEESELVPAEIIGRDPEIDVALLKVKIKTKLTAIPLGDSDAIDVGEYVLAIGNPLGYGHTVSHGILSAKGRRNPEFRMGRYLQTDASINPGNSGGPLINARGEVIGINNAIDARGQGIGFAIPINLVKGVLSQLKTRGTVSRGFLGVSATDLTPDIAEQLHISPKLKGVIVSDVEIGGAAATAGVRPYDVITSINGQAITDSQQLTITVSAIPIGQSAKMEIVRAGKPKLLKVKIAERPVEANLLPRKSKGRNPHQANFEEFGFGVEDAELDGKKVVVVSDVALGSPAANSGLNRGDVILDVSAKDVATAADLDRLMKVATKGPSVMIRVKREDPEGKEFVSVVVLTK
jgi:serine protease Do